MNNGLTIIIPTRNEERIILKTLDLINKKVRVPHEVIVVDGSSSDNTKMVVSSYAKSRNNIKFIIQKRNRSGFANAFALGVKNAKNKFIVFVMADFCDNLSTINKMFKKINEGWDVVCGSRYMKGGKKIGGPKIQGFFSYIVCKSLYYLFGIPTQDVSNSFKIYRRQILNKLVFNPKSSMEVSMELVLQAYFQGAKIVDIPTTWIGRTIGESKFKVNERMPKYLRVYVWAVKNSLRKAFGLKTERLI